MTTQDLTTWLSSAVIWLFDAVMAIGTIQHRSMIIIDVLLVAGGMLMRPAGRAGGRMYSSVKMKAQEIVKR